MEGVRFDKWLWAARFYKTRSLAQEAIEKGRARIASERVKPARNAKVGELVQVEQGEWEREIKVLALSDKRGSAPQAQLLFEDTPNSLAAKEKARAKRALFTEPAAVIKGRPSKRDRRQLDQVSND
jgi:ribosome-associated heat shock protein Hsp15